MTNNVRFFATALAASSIIALTGCLPPPPPMEPSGRPLENQYEDDLVFADIPVPRDFHYDRHESIRHSKGNVRIAHLVYRGAAHPKDVVKFYEDHMAQSANGWKKNSEEIVRGTGAHLLIFSKAVGPDRVEDLCIVTVLRERASTTITIEIK